MRSRRGRTPNLLACHHFMAKSERHPPKRFRADGDCQKESERAHRERSRTLQRFELPRRTALKPSSQSTSPTSRKMALENRPQGDHFIDEAVNAGRQVSVVRADADPCEPPAIVEFATKRSHLSNQGRHPVQDDAVRERTRRRPRAGADEIRPRTRRRPQVRTFGDRCATARTR